MGAATDLSTHTVSPFRTNPEALVAGERFDEIVATVTLVRVKAYPADRLGSLIDTQGSAVDLLCRARQGEQGALRFGERADPADDPEREIDRARGDVERWMASDLDIRTVLDPEYPSNLHEVFNRPPLLFVQGEWRETSDRWGIAVVGTRSATEDGQRRARRLARELAEAGYTVFSGLAQGIDAAAHRAALDAGGRTVAVMGTGLDHVYPAVNRDLANEVVQRGGALATQFFPHQGPARWTFPMRNAVMSGLSVATVVVEAGATSGARMQARLALEHGRTVFLLRSLVDDHEWGRRLVEEGKHGMTAIPVDGTHEILDRLEGRFEDSEAVAV